MTGGFNDEAHTQQKAVSASGGTERNIAEEQSNRSGAVLEVHSPKRPPTAARNSDKQEGSQGNHHDHNLSHLYRARNQLQIAVRPQPDAAGSGARRGQSASGGGAEKHRSVLASALVGCECRQESAPLGLKIMSARRLCRRRTP